MHKGLRVKQPKRSLVADLSEDELTDRRSSSSSSADSKNKRKKRATSKNWKDDFEFPNVQLSESDSEDEDWIKSEKSDDSDWVPVPRQLRGSRSSNSRPGLTVSNTPRVKSPVPTAKEDNASNSKKDTTMSSSVKSANNEESGGTEIPASASVGLSCFAGFSTVSTTNGQEKSFDSGKFIMVRSDYKTQKSPCIWRIDGKNLLQKYEPIVRNEGVAYRNMSTYSSWSTTNKGLYVPIDVTFCIQTKSETIVTMDRKKVLLPIEAELLEALNEEANAVADTFQIYLQTLISQALDASFISEITKEEDEYFLTSIAAVEEHWIQPKRDQLRQMINLRKSFQDALELYAGLELRLVTSAEKKCDVCQGKNPIRSFDFYTKTYDAVTLESTSSTRTPPKTYRCCLSCTDRVLLYHQLFHIRYHLFGRCKAKIDEYDRADGPAALKACLADQQWTSLMKRVVLLLLAEAQQTIIVGQQQAAGQEANNV